MGFSYQGRRLCCDKCGRADGTVRRRHCPHGYCPTYAVCRACWSAGEREKNKAYHKAAGCQEKHEAFEAQLRERAELMEAGVPVRTAAVNDGQVVKVWFRTASEELVRWMPHESYDQDFGINATLDHYRGFGPVWTERP